MQRQLTSELTIYGDVPINQTYKHTRLFKSKTEQLSYFSKQKVIKTYKNVQYIRNGETMSFKADVNANVFNGATYVSFINADYTTKRFYAFIMDVEYINETTCQIYFLLDVLQSYMFDYEFKDSFVVREHTKEYDKDGFPLKNTIDEGIAYGEKLYLQQELHVRSNDLGYHFLVIATKRKIHQNDDKGTGIATSSLGVPQPLCYYIVPFHRNRGSRVEVKWNHFNGKYADEMFVEGMAGVFAALYTIDSIVNEVVSLYVTDYFGLPFRSEEQSSLLDTIYFDAERTSYSFEHVRLAGTDDSNVECLWVKDIKEFQPMRRKLTSDLFSMFYNGTKPQCSKMLMYPYSQMKMTTFKGQQIDLIPSEFTNINVDVVIRGSLGTSNKVSYVLNGYGMDDDGSSRPNLENSVIDNNPNDVPVLVESLAAYLQGNRNSVQNKISSINFNTITGSIGSLLGGGQSAGASVAKGAGKGKAGVAGLALGAASSIFDVINTMGNGYLAMDALVAKKKDVENTPPSIQQMGANTSFDYGNDFNGVSVLFYTVNNENYQRLSKYFKVYGNKVNAIKTPNLRTRKHFNFIETENAFLVGSIPKKYLALISAIYDNGVTFWHTDDIGNYDLSNEVI